MPASSTPSSARQAPFAGSREPITAGRVLAVSAVKVAGGDRPWWVPFVHALALVPIAIAVVSVMVVRAFLRASSSASAGFSAKDGLIPSPLRLGSMLAPSKPDSSSPSLLLEGASVLLEYRAGRTARRADCAKIRLSTPKGKLECRYLAELGSVPVEVGDELQLWGTLGRDGVLRARRLENLSTGASHSVTLVPPVIAFAAAASMLFCLLILASVV